MKTLLITLVATASIVAMNASHADDSVLSSTIKYSSSTLQSEKSQATLYTKLRIAARQVCRADEIPTASIARSAPTAAIQHCIDQAMSNAIARVDSPSFKAYAAAQSGTPAQYIVAHE